MLGTVMKKSLGLFEINSKSIKNWFLKTGLIHLFLNYSLLYCIVNSRDKNKCCIVTKTNNQAIIV